MNARLLAARDTVPTPALGHAPQRLVERPALAAILGAEEPARHGAGPDAPGHTARLHHPDFAERPGMGVIGRIGGLLRKDRRRQFAPTVRTIATPQLGAEMAEIERAEQPAIRLRQHR